jgi:hypothetical protein
MYIFYNENLSYDEFAVVGSTQANGTAWPHSFLFVAKTAKRKGTRQLHLISFSNEYRRLSQARRVTPTGDDGCLKTA